VACRSDARLWYGCATAAEEAAVRSTTAAAADPIASLIFISGSFLNVVDLVCDEPVCFAVDCVSGVGVWRVDEAEDLARCAFTQ
jgi:hypothetical protein